jgi:hypothetical protein
MILEFLNKINDAWLIANFSCDKAELMESCTLREAAKAHEIYLELYANNKSLYWKTGEQYWYRSHNAGKFRCSEGHYLSHEEMFFTILFALTEVGCLELR